MAPQGIILILGVCVGVAVGFPGAAYQEQRQLYFPPHLPLRAAPVSPAATQYVYQPQPQPQNIIYQAPYPGLIPQGHLRTGQQVFYIVPGGQAGPQVYFEEGAEGGSTGAGEGGTTTGGGEGSGYVDSIIGFFGGVGNYIPWAGAGGEATTLAPQPAAEKPVEEATNAKRPQGEREDVANDLAKYQQQKFPLFHQQGFYGAKNGPAIQAPQFLQHFRKPYEQQVVQQDSMKPGTAAIAFQKLLSNARMGSHSDTGSVAVEAYDNNDEASDSQKEEHDQSELGPSIAQAKPQAVSVAGPGGVAAAAPVGTAIVGPGGMALSAPSATAIAGTKPTKPGAELKTRSYFSQGNLPGYFVQY